MLAHRNRWLVAVSSVVAVVALFATCLPGAVGASVAIAPLPSVTPSKATEVSTALAIEHWVNHEEARIELHWPSLPNIVTILELGGIATALCGVAVLGEPETLGGAAVLILPCLAAAAAFGGAVVWAVSNGGSGAPGPGSSAINVQDLSLFNAHSYETEIGGLGTDAGLVGSLLNLSAPYFAEQAESAALAQLGNATFNPILDAARSNIAVELGGIVTAEQESAASLLALAMANENQFLGRGNPSVWACSFNVTAGMGQAYSIDFPYIGASPVSNDCAVTAPSSYQYWEGHVVSTQTYLAAAEPACDLSSSTSAVWLNTSFPVILSATSHDVTGDLINVVNGTDYPFDVTAPHDEAGSAAFEANFTGIPTGPYYVCSGSDPFFLSPVVGAALTNESYDLTQYEVEAGSLGLLASPAPLYTHSPTEWFLINNDSASPVYQTSLGENGIWSLTQPNATWPFNTGSEIFQLGIDGAEYAGGHGGNQSHSNLNQLPYWASTVLTAAETEAGAYFTFLRGAGFHSATAVPAQCAIPPPSELIPPTLPPSEIAQLNYTTIENLYLAVLNGIGASYGGTSIDWTDCIADGLSGLPYPPTGGSGNWTLDNSGVNGTAIDSLGVYALGYLTDAQGGSGTRVFSNPRTWVDYGSADRGSGLFFIAPTCHVLTLVVGEINRLPDPASCNALNLWFQPLYTSDPAELKAFVLNWTAPTYCALVGFPHAGCNSTPAETYLYPVFGNSTLATGSVYSSPDMSDPDWDGSSGTGSWSLAVTACMVATGANATGVPTFRMDNTTGDTCRFTIGNINAKPWNVTCEGTVAANCVGNGTILNGPVPGSCSILTGIAEAIASELNKIPVVGGFLASLACIIAWAIVIVVAIAVLVAVWDEF